MSEVKFQRVMKRTVPCSSSDYVQAGRLLQILKEHVTSPVPPLDSDEYCSSLLDEEIPPPTAKWEFDGVTQTLVFTWTSFDVERYSARVKMLREAQEERRKGRDAARWATVQVVNKDGELSKYHYPYYWDSFDAAYDYVAGRENPEYYCLIPPVNDPVDTVYEAESVTAE